MFSALHRNSGGLGDRKSRAPPWRTAPCAAWILTWRPERAMTPSRVSPCRRAGPSRGSRGEHTGHGGLLTRPAQYHQQNYENKDRYERGDLPKNVNRKLRRRTGDRQDATPEFLPKLAEGVASQRPVDTTPTLEASLKSLIV